MLLDSWTLLQWVRMAERSKALRSGRSPLLWALVRIPLLTKYFLYDLGLVFPARVGGYQWAVSVVVITSALHAEGRQFEPGRNQDYFVETGLKT